METLYPLPILKNPHYVTILSQDRYVPLETAKHLQRSLEIHSTTKKILVAFVPGGIVISDPAGRSLTST